jgi:hypothetical protein
MTYKTYNTHTLARSHAHTSPLTHDHQPALVQLSSFPALQYQYANASVPSSLVHRGLDPPCPSPGCSSSIYAFTLTLSPARLCAACKLCIRRWRLLLLLLLDDLTGLPLHPLLPSISCILASSHSQGVSRRFPASPFAGLPAWPLAVVMPRCHVDTRLGLYVNARC